jgi:type IV secretory pathway VirB10-like protein
MRVSRRVLLLGAIVIFVGIGLLTLAQRAIPSVGVLMAAKPAEPVRKVALPERLKEPARPYAPPEPVKPAPPVAQPIVRAAAPVAQPQPIVVPPIMQAQTQPTPDFFKMWDKQQEAVAKAAQPQTPTPKHEPPKRQPWIITPTDITIKRDGGAKEESKEGKGSQEQREAVAAKGDATQLIKPAVWARPAYPLKTLYRSQPLPCRLVDAINTDIPGQIRLALTVPVFDRFRREYEILPKDTQIIAMQEGKLQYGNRRANVKLQQLELPTGEVIHLNGTVGDEQGNGLGLNIDNHLGKLLLATGISAILNIGVRSAAGTPGAGSYFQNPIQSAAGDIGAGVQKQAESVVDRELRVPPTGTRDAETACSVNLLENIQFHRRPVVVR